jgi:hypothetical protein
MFLLGSKSFVLCKQYFVETVFAITDQHCRYTVGKSFLISTHPGPEWQVTVAAFKNFLNKASGQKVDSFDTFSIKAVNREFLSICVSWSPVRASSRYAWLTGLARRQSTYLGWIPG